MDRDGGCKQGTDMGRQVWGQVEECTGRGDTCEDGEKWEENDGWRVGRRRRCGKDRTQKQAATNHAVPLYKREQVALSPNAAICWKNLPDMLILFDQDLLLPSAGKPITMTMYPSPYVEGCQDPQSWAARLSTEPQKRGTDEGAPRGQGKGCQPWCLSPLTLQGPAEGSLVGLPRRSSFEPHLV